MLKVGIITGLIFALIDFLLWAVFINYIGSTGSFYFVNDLLTQFWNAIHTPINYLFEPYLLPYIPSHGGGIKAILAFSTYIALCIFQLFVIGFLLGTLILKLTLRSANT